MVEELRRCIFCTNLKRIDEFNKEHVIPAAIGGKVVIHHVCIDCNSNLGNQADHHLTDHFIIQLFRWEHKIGDLSNSFPEGRAIEDPTQIIYTDIRGGVLVQKMPVQKIQTEDPNIIRFTGDAKDQKAIRAAVDKTLKRKGNTPITDKEFIESLIETPVTGMTAKISVDEFYYKRALAKIAYEMTWRWLGDSYIDDELAPKIRDFIRYGELETDCSFIKECRLFTEEESSKINPPTDHTVVLEISEESITCEVSIADIFVGVFTMSQNPKDYKCGFSIADLTNNAVNGRVEEKKVK